MGLQNDGVHSHHHGSLNFSSQSMNKNIRQALIHLGLFALTLFTTVLAGAGWVQRADLYLYDETGLNWEAFHLGWPYALAFLAILTVHEFGHYFTARFYRVKTSLPYYIPIWLGPGPSIGTLGAVIRIREAITSRKIYFDVGIAGPLAGFVVALGVLWYGFTHLPPAEYVLEIHPEYAEMEGFKEYGTDYEKYAYKELEAKDSIPTLKMGTNLLFLFFERYVVPADQRDRIPSAHEMMHYPLLMAGFLACFFTALNLLPIGQLDGGHVMFGLFGEKHARTIAFWAFSIFLFYGGLGLFSIDTEPNFWNLLLAGIYVAFLLSAFSRTIPNFHPRMLFIVGLFAIQFFLKSFFPWVDGYNGWLLLGFLLGRVMGVYHPPVIDHQPLSTGRKILGWIAVIVFIICVSPQPFVMN